MPNYGKKSGNSCMPRFVGIISLLLGIYSANFYWLKCHKCDVSMSIACVRLCILKKLCGYVNYPLVLNW